MTERNIHGNWTMSFESRVFIAKVIGATNKEAGQQFVKDMQEIVLSSAESDCAPWVFINDGRLWEMDSMDTDDIYREFMSWLSAHNCVYYALVFSKKIQKFAMDERVGEESSIQFYFDYEEAHRDCLQKLAEAQP